jgi:hypothetical protein
MLRSPIRIAVLILLSSCGGRDPLVGPIEPDPGTPTDGATSPPTNPPASPDARPTQPPGVPRDASADVAPFPPPPVMPPPVTPPPPPTTPMCPFPKCIAALMAPCTPMGICTSRMSNIGTNICYANVRFIPELGAMGPNPTYVVRALTTSANGTSSTCYSLEAGIRRGSGGMGATATITYRSASGAVVATGTLAGGNTLVINCPNEPPAMIPVSCQPGLAGIGGMGGGATMCVPSPMCR